MRWPGAILTVNAGRGAVYVDYSQRGSSGGSNVGGAGPNPVSLLEIQQEQALQLERDKARHQNTNTAAAKVAQSVPKVRYVDR